jgi:hypothetical protein
LCDVSKEKVGIAMIWKENECVSLKKKLFIISHVYRVVHISALLPCLADLDRVRSLAATIDQFSATQKAGKYFCAGKFRRYNAEQQNKSC